MADWMRSGSVIGSAPRPRPRCRPGRWPGRATGSGPPAGRASSMRATSRPPSSWVGSACHTFEPSRLSSIWPPATAGDLVAHRHRHLGRIRRRRASKASVGGSGSQRSRTGCEALAAAGCRRRPRATPAASHSPSPRAPADRPAGRPPPPVGGPSSKPCRPGGQISSARPRSGRGRPRPGSANPRRTSCSDRQASPPSTPTATAPGAVRSTRTVTGCGDAQRCRRCRRPGPPAAASLRARSAVSTAIRPGPLVHGIAPREVAGAVVPPSLAATDQCYAGLDADVVDGVVGDGLCSPLVQAPWVKGLSATMATLGGLRSATVAWIWKLRSMLTERAEQKRLRVPPMQTVRCTMRVAPAMP